MTTGEQIRTPECKEIFIKSVQPPHKKTSVGHKSVHEKINIAYVILNGLCDNYFPCLGGIIPIVYNVHYKAFTSFFTKLCFVRCADCLDTSHKMLQDVLLSKKKEAVLGFEQFDDKKKQ